MSFTTEIKQEIANNKKKLCCAKAELSALIHLTSSLTITNKKMSLLTRTENPTTAKRIVQLLKKIYGVKTNLEVSKKCNLRKNSVYRVKVEEDVKKIIKDLGIYGKKGISSKPSYKMVKNQCCQKAYIAGAFLAYGTCNSPRTSNYHFEISTPEKDLSLFIKKLFEKQHIEAKIVKRRNRYVVYIKKAIKIEDALKLIGASDSLIAFVNNRVNRDYKTNYNRIENCITVNIAKSLKAADKQTEIIKKIKKMHKEEKLDAKLREIVDLRIKYPESTLLELCKAYESTYGNTISKSGIKHRLNKLEEFAKNL